MTAEKYIARLKRNLVGTSLILIATVSNMIGHAMGEIPDKTFAIFAPILFICACLTIYWTHCDKRLSPFHGEKE